MQSSSSSSYYEDLATLSQAPIENSRKRPATESDLINEQAMKRSAEIYNYNQNYHSTVSLLARAVNVLSSAAGQSDRQTPPMATKIQPAHFHTPAASDLPQASVVYTPESDTSSSTIPSFNNSMASNNSFHSFPVPQMPQLPQVSQKPQVQVPAPMRELPNPNECIAEVDGRLPVVGDRSKYKLTVAELQRRVSGPESMNQSSMHALFRLEMLEKYGILFTAHHRQRNPNSFSYLLEEEATRFAQDIDMLYKAFFPSDPIGRGMIEKMLASGKTPDAIEIILQNGVTAMSGLVKTLESRQPTIVYKERRVKGNSLDSDYEQVSALTHGFAHPTSITNYRFMQAAFGRALSAIQAVKQGRALAKNCSIDPLAEKPFKYMTDAAYEEWKNVMNGHPSEPKFTNPVLWGGEPPV
ncbi:unnamed protein product [Caenorhabditis sp. 36 PRJEB53466]|nr:unnamed protein product [Caenorhabditis sp. 36 PRJEB53466]